MFTQDDRMERRRGGDGYLGNKTSLGGYHRPYPSLSDSPNRNGSRGGRRGSDPPPCLPTIQSRTPKHPTGGGHHPPFLPQRPVAPSASSPPRTPSPSRPTAAPSWPSDPRGTTPRTPTGALRSDPPPAFAPGGGGCRIRHKAVALQVGVRSAEFSPGLGPLCPIDPHRSNGERRGESSGTSRD